MKAPTKKQLEKEREQALAMFNKELKKQQAHCLAYQKKRGYLHASVVQRAAGRLHALACSYDPRMRGAVSIAHEDGSHYLFNYAWFETFGDPPTEEEFKNFNTGKAALTRSDFLVVFSEHQGTVAFSIGDLAFHMMLLPNESLKAKWR